MCFDDHDVLLPGERRTLVLHDDEDIRVLQHASDVGAGCFGQLLERSPPRNRMLGFSWHEDCAPLLQVMEIKHDYISDEDDSSCAGATWTEIKCVGRVRLEAAPRTSVLSSGSGCLAARAAWLVDEAPKEGRKPASVSQIRAHCTSLSELEEARRDCHAASQTLAQLTRGGRSDSRHETNCAGTYAATLDDHISLRRETLLQQGLDEPPATTLRALQPAWGACCEVSMEAQLESWAACAWLAGDERLEAFRSRSVARRLELATRRLFERRRELTTEISLERALFNQSEHNAR